MTRPVQDEPEAREETGERDERRAKLARLRAEGIDPFPRRFPGRVQVAAVHEAHDAEALEPGEHPQWTYRVAGRLVARRGHGRTTFIDVRDRSGTLQVYAREDALGEEPYARMLDLDVGDVVGVEGVVYVTRRGQLALSMRSCALLTKALRPPPDRFHGVQKPEIRYQQRELDLLASERSREIFALRAKTLAALRDWLNERGFVELETPVLQRLPGGAAARPFTTHHNALNREVSLRMATELYLKRCIVGGFEDVYELGKSFRNEGMSHEHNPEFTMLEWFQSYSDYNDVMTFCEEMVAGVAQRVLGRTTVERDGAVIDLAPPWPRVSLRNAIMEVSGVDVLSADRDRLVELVGDEVPPSADWAWLANALQGKLVEPTIVQPTFLTDLPLEIWPLVNRHPEHPQLGEAFDAIIAGMEIAGGGTDINDPIDQELRFVDQRKRLEMDDGELPHPQDHDFVRALEYGMLPASGCGIGIDRLMMLLTGSRSLRDVILFPA